MKIEQNFELKPFNTFGMSVQAQSFVRVNSIFDIKSLIKEGYFNQPFLILGGGSNILFTQDFTGIVVKNELLEKTILEETEEYVVVRFGAGEIWHETVMFAVNSGWGGLENLSLIPGSVGAAPIQNIGAYGVEIKDVLLQVNFIDLIGGEEKSLSNAECFFDYRNSIFKNELKNKVIVTSIDLKLNKNSTLKLDYGDIKSELSKQNIEKPTIKDVSQAVINIRQSKLPDPKELGNSGSFFKNPVIENELLQKIIQTNPEVKSYPIDENHSKLAAGWLIEQAGWKGKRVGNTGSHKNQALVLVNYGNATGKEIKNLAYTIIDSVERQFGVRLEPEVNII